MEGILIINKPKWYTSFDVVAKVRRILKTKKVGHTGTLDPMATGVLVLCIGKATKLVNKLVLEDKIYKTTLKLGIKTHTGDMTGNILNACSGGILPSSSDDYFSPQNENCSGEQCSPQKPHLSDITKQKFEQNLTYANSLNNNFNLSQTQIEETLKSFIGKQIQTPSIYSSIKVDGKKLYEYAREGIEVEIPKREIEILDIYDISFNGKDEITYTVHCSKGTYIRTLNEDVAKKLGLEGTTLELQRIKTGEFSIENAINIEDVSEEKIIPM